MTNQKQQFSSTKFFFIIYSNIFISAGFPEIRPQLYHRSYKNNKIYLRAFPPWLPIFWPQWPCFTALTDPPPSFVTLMNSFFESSFSCSLGSSFWTKPHLRVGHSRYVKDFKLHQGSPKSASGCLSCKMYIYAYYTCTFWA